MRLSALIVLACVAAAATPAGATAGAPAPMDAAAQQQAPNQLPDTVTPDGMHVGSWSAGSQKAPAAPHPQVPSTTGTATGTAASAPDGINVGSWSAGKTAGAATAGAPPMAGTQGSGGAMEGEHSYVVTSIQSCYDQLDPADVADIKKNFLKPYAECQARLEAKQSAKKDAKAGEAAKAAIPESPRNYIRVQAPDNPPTAANTSDKSGTKTVP